MCEFVGCEGELSLHGAFRAQYFSISEISARRFLVVVLTVLVLAEKYLPLLIWI
jgi:hypothetical protein